MREDLNSTSLPVAMTHADVVMSLGRSGPCSAKINNRGSFAVVERLPAVEIVAARRCKATFTSVQKRHLNNDSELSL